jgi:2-polyprenyl-3-methyl-5-hydroxy-6-metoxy-1,4-benzoquinol methylase
MQSIRVVVVSHYPYKYAVHYNSSATKVARMVGSGRRVLELGCGPGMITQLLAKQQCRVTALERDVSALKVVAQYCEVVYACDLNDLAWHATLADVEKFDAVVAGDVLEHLLDPWATLKFVGSLLSKGGHIVISLPHVGHNAIIATLIASDFVYQPWGILDKTHLRFFGMHNIQAMCEGAGLKIVEVDYVVKPPEQTEFARRWHQLPAATKNALAANPFGSVYQVVVKAVPYSTPGKGLKLAALPVPRADLGRSVSLRTRLWYFFLSFVSLSARQRIAHVLSSLKLRH